MGRHRRSAAGRAARDRATGVVPQVSGGEDDGPRGDGRPVRGIAPYLDPEAYARSTARSEEFLYATDDDYPRTGQTSVFGADGDTPGTDGGSGAHRRPRKKGARPVRTGLLGVSAAVALGTVAVATGVVPGTDTYRFGGDGDKIQAADSPTGTPSAQGGTSGDAEGTTPGTSGTSGGARTPAAPAPGTAPASPDASADRKTPESKAPQKSASPSKQTPERKTTAPSTPASKQPTTKPATPSPSRTATKAPVVPPSTPAQPSSPGTVSREAVAAAEVLRLVNVERATAGCGPVAANSALSGLARNFSADMAARGFFDHTDPDGDTPWDRAAQAGITNLGGENIARGQADAAAVMDAWMNSEGHRANILNCDFTTLGVGVQFGSGGPWWTQNFGY
ncbi:CAP domain-containing protein [Streptomyces sp. NPDC048290]|uniref:CAP domain-containing protein n=1 Tax=Streptomyces sp. NPDC048290 TaxID=3155811 RepID=UPI003416A2DE